MKVIVADTSPLNDLVLIGQVDLLAQLYGEVLIPDIVVSELCDPDAPLVVASWAASLPSWINVRATPMSSEQVERLDAGERAAILLAEVQTSPVLPLMDDADGRAGASPRLGRSAPFAPPRFADWWTCLQGCLASGLRISGARSSPG